MRLANASLLRLAALAASLVGAPQEVMAQEEPLPNSAPCSIAGLELVLTPEQARALATRCVDVPSVHFKALDELNAMPLPSEIPTVTSRNPLGAGVPTEKVRLSLNVFFYLDEAYPSPVGLTRLAELVRKIDAAGDLEVVAISSSENAVEHGSSTDVAELRTAFVRRYLVAAGIDAHRIYGEQRAPMYDDTPEGRARDRRAEILVVLHRGITSH